MFKTFVFSLKKLTVYDVRHRDKCIRTIVCGQCKKNLQSEICIRQNLCTRGMLNFCISGLWWWLDVWAGSDKGFLDDVTGL